jgi:hypothetical protein
LKIFYRLILIFGTNLLLSLTFIPIGQGDERIAVPFTRATFIPPKGFQYIPKMRMFVDEKSDSSILPSEIPASIEMATRGFTAEGFKAKGMQLIKREKRAFGNGFGYVIEAQEKAEENAEKKGTNRKSSNRKMIVALGEIETTMFAATYPSDLKSEKAEAIRQALLSIRLREEFTREPEVDRSVPEAFKSLIQGPSSTEKK